MCRFLAVIAPTPFDPLPWIPPFADRCRRSQEYQGHGWGVACWTGEGWENHRTLDPIWEAALPSLVPTTSLLVHARSAFRNEGIEVTNNMPFVEDDLAFAFNGELRGVRLRTPGTTGAARLFRLLRSFRGPDSEQLGSALLRLNRVIGRRTDHLRALNLAVGDGEAFWVSSAFSEDPAYFTLWRALAPALPAGMQVVASERFDLATEALSWEPIPRNTMFHLAPESSVPINVPCTWEASCSS